MLSPQFMWLVLIVNAIGGASYLASTLRGRTRPNRVTWFLWTLLPTVVLVGQLAEGVELTVLLTVSAVVMPALIFAASFTKHNADFVLTRFDLVCGGLSLLGLLLWGLTRDANVAIALTIAADALAGFPTIRKAFLRPETEDATAYVLATVAAGITLLTIDTWTFAEYGFAVYVMGICGLIAVLALRRSSPMGEAAATAATLAA